MDSICDIYYIYVSLLVIRNSYNLNMRRSFQNIKLSYLFRHAGNYKAFGYVILKNSDGRIPKEIDADLRRILIDGTYFYSEQVQLPGLDESEKRMYYEYERVKVLVSTGSKFGHFAQLG